MEIPEHELKELLLDLEKLEKTVAAQIRRLKIGIKILMDPNPPSRKPVVIHSPYVNQRGKKASRARDIPHHPASSSDGVSIGDPPALEN